MILMTNTGRTVSIDWHGRSDFDRCLYIGTKDLTMAEAAIIFGSSAETSRLTVYADEQNMEDESTQTLYTGFTELRHLRNNTTDGTVNVGLARQEVEE